jgi:site-specific recombinase XerD
MRHSFCTALAAAGMDLRSLMHLAGHSSYVTTLRYAHFSPTATMGREFMDAAFSAKNNGETTAEGAEKAS